MLPAPVSFLPRRSSRRSIAFTRSRPVDALIQRARVTNLGLLILVAFATGSFLLNLRNFLSTPTCRVWPDPPASILSTLGRDKALRNLDHLIIVVGHAIWQGVDVTKRLHESEWALAPYQRGGGRVAAFYEHIKQGAELAMQDEHSLLVFSGGRTMQTSTTSEAESYLRLALASNLLQRQDLAPFARATTEDYSLDSYQNLLFSIARFHEYTGRYPTKLTVVGYEMKKRRFAELHRAAVRWPKGRFYYVGIDPEGENITHAQDGEAKNGYRPFTSDLYGCHSFLLAKRRRRNQSARFHSYHTSSPELRGLLDWCPSVDEGGNAAIYPGPLPWDRS